MMCPPYKISLISAAKNPYDLFFCGAKVLATLSVFLSFDVSANIIASDHQNFNGAPSSKDYITVQSAKTLGSGGLSLGIFFDQSTNTLPYFYDSENPDSLDDESELKSEVVGGDFLAAIGITDVWDIYISTPSVIDQKTYSDKPRGQFQDTGNLGLRLGTKLSLLSSQYLSLASSLDAYIDRTEDNPIAGPSGRTSYAAQIIPEVHLGIVDISMNLGYRWKPTYNDETETDDSIPVSPTGNQTIGSIGLNIQATENLSLTPEIYGASSNEDFSENSTRLSEIIEGIVGVQYGFTENFKGSIGAGSEINHSISSPDMRYFAGIRWTSNHKKSPSPKIIKTVTKESHPDETIIVSDILFKFNSSEIERSRAFRELAKVAQAIKPPNKLKRIVIEGHTCSIGKKAYNNQLSRRRAESIRQFLIKYYKVPAYKSLALGKGENHPIATNRTSIGRKKNRRVEFKIYYQK